MLKNLIISHKKRRFEFFQRVYANNPERPLHNKLYNNSKRLKILLHPHYNIFYTPLQYFFVDSVH